MMYQAEYAVRADVNSYVPVPAMVVDPEMPETWRGVVGYVVKNRISALMQREAPVSSMRPCLTVVVMGAG